MTQKITPHLWFDRNCEEAATFYTSVFKNSKVTSIKRYPDGPLEGPMKGMEGQVLTEVFELEGQRFMALDGGPIFKFTPAVSFMVQCESSAEVDALYEKLSPGGSVLMPLQSYPFSERYAWISDKYGLSWQLNAQTASQKIAPALMFVGEHFGKAEEAINFYTSIFRNSSIEAISRYEEGEGDEPGKVKYASFLIEGYQFVAMESSFDHKFAPNESVSFLVECKDQEEIDYYWQKLSAVPESEQCGWLKDKYGFSWQIVPNMSRWMNETDKERSDRALQAMLQMKKIDIAMLERAYNSA